MHPPRLGITRVALVVSLLLAALLWLRPDTPQAADRQETGVAPTGRADAHGLKAPVRRSIKRAIRAAAADGVPLRITSGYRTASRQAVLFDEAIAKYGSPAAARRWVLPPHESEHVTGGAVDVGPPSGAAWLARNGEGFGLCQRYANEPWHFERLAGALGSSCPPLEDHP